MAEVIFYEKPGCINNTKQTQLLAFAGHVVIARNLLTESWSGKRLNLFFKHLPVSEWFNRSAPRIRDGEIYPDRLDETKAMALMIAEPLLIRRPLMIVDGEYLVGFDASKLNARFSLGLETEDEDLESCPRKPEHETGCEVTA